MSRKILYTVSPKPTKATSESEAYHKNRTASGQTKTYIQIHLAKQSFITLKRIIVDHYRIGIEIGGSNGNFKTLMCS
jgi:hypothetical protein